MPKNHVGFHYKKKIKKEKSLEISLRKIIRNLKLSSVQRNRFRCKKKNFVNKVRDDEVKSKKKLRKQKLKNRINSFVKNLLKP